MLYLGAQEEGLLMFRVKLAVFAVLTHSLHNRGGRSRTINMFTVFAGIFTGSQEQLMVHTYVQRNSPAHNK